MVDSVITLFESTETVFTSNGLGSLTDAISCKVTEERNGAFELEMVYPVDGLHANDLIGYYNQNGDYVSSLRRIIYCKSSVLGTKQPFRIYAVSKPINGQVTINAEHISYDLSGIPVSPFTANSAAEALGKLKSSSAIDHGFTFWTDKSTEATMSFAVPKSLRNLLGGEEGSVLDHYGGEYEFDKFDVKLHNNRGADRGVTIRYGKNLTDLEQEENCADVYTGVYPYWYREGDDPETNGLVEVDGKIVNVEGTFNFRRILTLDLTNEFEDKPSKADLKKHCEDYIKRNNIGVPKVSLKVSFIQLSQAEEYAEYALLENVYLCDTVSVYFPELGVTNSRVKCIKTVFDVLTDKYESIELGEAVTKLSDTVAGQGQAIQTEVEGLKSFLELSIQTATNALTSGLGGYVVMHRSSGADTKSGYPDEILICTETPDIRVAQGMWRFNKAGLAFSSTGYEGPFDKVAILADGTINAERIRTGTMSANLVRGGTFMVGGLNNQNGKISMVDSEGKEFGSWDNTGLKAQRGEIGGFTIENTNILKTRLRNGAEARLTGSGANYRMWEDSAGRSDEVYPFITAGNTDSEMPDSEMSIGVMSNGDGFVYADRLYARDIEIYRDNKWIGIRDYVNRDY